MSTEFATRERFYRLGLSADTLNAIYAAWVAADRTKNGVEYCGEPFWLSGENTPSGREIVEFRWGMGRNADYLREEREGGIVRSSGLWEPGTDVIWRQIMQSEVK